MPIMHIILFCLFLDNTKPIIPNTNPNTPPSKPNIKDKTPKTFVPSFY